MEIKKSAFAGPAIERLLTEKNISGEQLAKDLNISTQHGSNIKNGRRTLQADIAQESIAMYDSPAFSMDILYEFSDGYTSPVFRGKNIESHRLSFAENARREIQEGLDLLKNICLAKPPSMMDVNEREAVVSMVDELLESKAHTDNFLMQIQIEYGISIKERTKVLKPRWKAKGWL